MSIKTAAYQTLHQPLAPYKTEILNQYKAFISA
nr:MAG TPA: hypothetical protein [Caudoviricetes sp.]